MLNSWDEIGSFCLLDSVIGSFSLHLPGCPETEREHCALLFIPTCPPYRAPFVLIYGIEGTIRLRVGPKDNLLSMVEFLILTTTFMIENSVRIFENQCLF